jgi:N utilization substance protein A
MEVIVEDKQLSLAIGKKGQNVRLAAKLTGWKIDIKSEEEKRREVEAILGEMEGPAAAEPDGSAEPVEASATSQEAVGTADEEPAAPESAMEAQAAVEPEPADAVEPERAEEKETL